MGYKNRIRIILIILILASTGFLYQSYATASVTEGGESESLHSGIPNASKQVAPPRDNITVVVTHAATWYEAEQNTSQSALIAFAPNGSLYYFNNSRDRYYDVDPVTEGRTTVQYVAAKHLNASACPRDNPCTRNIVETVNLTTGKVTTEYVHQINKTVGGNRYHDVDRINRTHLVIADIAFDRVFIVNVTSGETVWEWEAEEHFAKDTGGEYGNDWTHLNDVEYLGDGRIMASIRNHDQVVFIDIDGGVDESWTLGSDDDYGILNEQHNPDYIPPSNGGPAIVVADSSNTRIVEYQRSNEEWKRTWLWQDSQMSWPRDADRLPNGHTLITDSLGDRILEVDTEGEIVWSVDVAFPYEAERLGTGPESENGPSAQAADLKSKRETSNQLWNQITKYVPNKLLQTVLYLLPVWTGVRDIIPIMVLFLSVLTWIGLESRWKWISIRS